MQIPTHYQNAKKNSQGFALIATISVMVLLVMIALAMLSLSTLELKSSRLSTHQAEAHANARLALMQAINELQKHTGPDQRVTARAAIFETDTTTLANRNWLGVWSTTVESGDQNWPVIGKAPSSGTNTSPYSRPGAYEDLRHTQANLSGDAWKNELRRTWLVSQRDTALDFTKALDASDANVIEIIGKGTLGKSVSGIDYDRERVLVQKIDVDGKGAYAWYISDNNQKASVDPLAEVDLVDAAFDASPRANPELVESGGGTPFSGFTKDAQKHSGKLLTYLTAPLTQGDPDAMKELLGKHYHHFTTYSPGLFTNTLEGGLRNDLTPLLLANKGDKKVGFSIGQGSGTRKFSSSYPIIPGPDHGVLGPSFGALRNWAQHTYTDLKDAETSFGSSATRMRPATHWPHNISDGACADASEWAESAPKIHPVMTDCRWHYYFSHHNNRIRTHIIPRVCLWNPYNRDLTIPSLSVLMPNPFYNLTHGIHFFPDAGHVEALKKKYESDGGHPFTRWDARGGYFDGDVYKIRVNPFPEQRYLAFTLEATMLAAGECHVFSPKYTSSVDGNLKKYEPISASSNMLSSSSLQGESNFYYDHGSSGKYELSPSSGAWISIKNIHLAEIDFSRIEDYQPEVVMQSNVESFPFALKVGTSSSIASLYTSTQHPTLQLVYGGAGGDYSASYFAYDGDQWGSANQQTDSAFGPLQKFSEAPFKDAPRNHQVGAKLLWLNENNTEGASEDAGLAPLRGGRWGQDHMVYNPAPIANWNVRAQLSARSPSSQCARRWFMHSMGSWITQYQPYSPQNLADHPSPGRSGALVKNPFGSKLDFPFDSNVVLFDLPHKDYGVLSLGKLRHAMLSPYSWAPSYIVGSSLRDMHAPSNYSAHDMAVGDDTGGYVTRWDYLLGNYQKKNKKPGAYAKTSDSQGLLQIGTLAVSRSIDGANLSSENEVLAYDIAYEVNQNLWDQFFISSMPFAIGRQSFEWDAVNNKKLWNSRYQYNYDNGLSRSTAQDLVASADGLKTAFWRNAELFKNKAAFNVNSTSVIAWTAFLSGTLGESRPMKSGSLSEKVISFARYTNPEQAVETSDANPKSRGAWVGSRQLSEPEVRRLAENIVAEVRKRGPFVSLADFVNRRLTDADDETSHMGVLDAAIMATNLNSGFYKPGNEKYNTTAINSGGGERDNNQEIFKNSYRYSQGGKTTTVQPTSQAWGLPGFLTQGDLLEPLAPAMSVRGDTYTIRAYGESRANDEVKAQAWLEVVVERSPHYAESRLSEAVSTAGNAATDRPLSVQYTTGQYLDGNLSDINKRFGRVFTIKSSRWLSPKEI